MWSSRTTGVVAASLMRLYILLVLISTLPAAFTVPTGTVSRSRMSASTLTIRERILEAAFTAFMRFGYGGTSTAQIARLARVSKRDLYANFGSKQAMLASCVTERAERMRRPLELPA